MYFTKLLASELGQYGIRVNGVHPGPIWAPAVQGYLQSLADGRGVDLQVVYDEWAAETALKYLVPPEDITGTVVFSLSDRRAPSPARRSTPAPASEAIEVGWIRRACDVLGSRPLRHPGRRPARHGTGVYRRRIRIETVAPGVVVAELEDDYHHFRCTVHHDGRVVTASEGEAVRYPWGTCPGATSLVGQLAGMPLAPNSTAVGGHADVGEQCTHLFDLAGLGAAHVWAGRERREYAIDVPDRLGTSITLPVMARDGSRSSPGRLTAT